MKKKLWKVSRKFGSLCWKMVEVFCAFVLVVGALALYRLHQEPLDAMQYIPEIEGALLPTDKGYHMHATSVLLTSDWSRDGLVQIDIENLQVLRGDDTLAFSAPSAHFSYDLWHILTLNYMPSTIVVEKPFLEMIIDEKGTWAVKTEKSEAKALDITVFRNIISRILSIRELKVNEAHFCLKDERVHQKWEIKEAHLDLQRRFRFSNRAILKASLLGEGIKSRFLATAKFNRLQRILSVEMGLDQLNLKKIAAFIPILQEADLEVQLSVKGEFDLERNHQKVTDYVSKIQFNAKTLKAGTLNLMGDLDNVYRVQSADINGTLGQDAKVLKIASSKIKLQDEKPADFYLDVTGLDDYLNTQKSEQVRTILRAVLYDVPTAHIPVLWPSKQSPDAHKWVKTHLSQGQISEASFTLHFKGDEMIDVSGKVQASGVRVNYLPPMKPIENVSAEVLLYRDKVRILGNKGTIQDLSLNKADLLFTDLHKDESWLQIDFEATGPVSQALALVDSRPLELMRQVHVKPSSISGQANIFTHLSFPLLEHLKAEQIQAVVHADVTDATVNAPWAYLGLKEGALSVDVSNEGLVIAGDILMKNSPLKIKWHESFEPKEVMSEYAVSGTLQGADLGGLWPQLPSLIKGPMEVNLTANKNNQNLYTGSLILNAEQAWVNLAPLGVKKEKKDPLVMNLAFSKANATQGNASLILEGKIKEEELKAMGRANWNAQKKQVVLSDVHGGGNQFSGEMLLSNTDFALRLKGKNWRAYDIKKLLSVSEQSTSDSPAQIPPNITLDIMLDRFSLNAKKPFKNVSIVGERHGNIWQNFHAQAIASDPFVIVYEPKKHEFQGSIADFGDFVDRLDISDRFTGGKLSLTASQKEKGTLQGKIQVQETELKETGFFMQAVTILGIVDAFRGKDMVFSDIEVPFDLEPDLTLKMEDAYAVGTNLGVTFKGNITPEGHNLSGAVVPAYAVNSLPGKIPVLGWLFRDSVAGGLINVPFTVEGSLMKPQVNWNPLKTVAPGALGRLF